MCIFLCRLYSLFGRFNNKYANKQTTYDIAPYLAHDPASYPTLDPSRFPAHDVAHLPARCPTFCPIANQSAHC